MKAILAAIDFSRVSDRIVAEAAALARLMDGRVVLITVVAEAASVKECARPPKGIARITIGHEQVVLKRLKAIQQKLQSDFIPTERIMRRGDPAREILAEAEKHDTAFIVIGSHGHTALFELLLGSTTQAVLKRARQPVIVIPSRIRKSTPMRVRVVAYGAAD